jgi:superfamily II DNA or RNA helicase
MDLAVATPPQRTYGNLEQVTRFGDAKWLMSNVKPHVAIRLKQLFPRIPKTDPGPWLFDGDTQTASDLSWFMLRYPMEMKSQDIQALAAGCAEYERTQNELEFILNTDYKAPAYAGLREGQALRDYQGQAIEVLKRRKGLLLGDEVGLGKTFTCIGAALLEGGLPAVITVEPHVQEQWRDRIESFSTLRVHVIKTTKPYQLPEADVYLFRYSNIFGWVDILANMNIGLAAWDEIQSLRKGRASRKGQVSYVVASQARYRMGLTATPIYNYGDEIWSVMMFIDDQVLGSHLDFVREWTNGPGTIKDAEALGTYLRDQHVFIRRRRSDVGRELPEVNKVVDYVAYDEGIVKDAESLARQLAIKASSGSFIERGQAARDLDALVRHSTGLAKASMVAEYTRIVLEAGEPVLLLGWHRDVYDVWLKRLADFEPAMYTGSETAAQKLESERRFLSGETNLLIMSLRSGAGLDSLQHRCRTCIFGELDWSPGIHHQIIGRLNRDRDDGEVNHVMAIFLVSDEGSDPPMLEVLGLKASESHAIVDPNLGVQRAHSDASNIKKLVDIYLSKRPARS